MYWVIPPASPAATLVLRIVSRSDVFPWSTWPIIVTTGGITTMLSSLREAIIASFADSPLLFCTAVVTVGALRLCSKPRSCATMAAFSYSTTWLMLAKMPCLMRPRIVSLGVVCNSSARSFTTICAGIEIGPVGFSFTAATRRSCGRCAGVPGGHQYRDGHCLDVLEQQGDPLEYQDVLCCWGEPLPLVHDHWLAY